MATESLRRRVERFHQKADEALDRLDWAEARARAEAALDLDPENAEAKAVLTAVARADQRTAPSLGAELASAMSPATSAIPASGHPTSFANGRYAVKRFLGEEGKKKVFLAHDTLPDRDVAFDLVKAEGLDEAARACIRGTC